MRMEDGKVESFVAAVYVWTDWLKGKKSLGSIRLVCRYSFRARRGKGSYVCGACGRGVLGPDDCIRSKCRVCGAKVEIERDKPMDTRTYRARFADYDKLGVV